MPIALAFARTSCRLQIVIPPRGAAMGRGAFRFPISRAIPHDGAAARRRAMTIFDLSGKVAIVTGSSRGIGLAIAETFAEAGARVVISSRRAEACDEAVARLRGLGSEAIAVPARISDKGQLENLVARTRDTWGRIDILVCNAAVNPHYGSLDKLTDEVFERMMVNNVLSNLWLSRLVAPEMRARRDGSIIFIISVAALRSTTVLGMYGVTKAADYALCRNLAAEWGPDNVRVNCIAPGLIKTEFSRVLYENPERRAAREAATPLRRLGEPSEIAGAALLLASPAGSYITGQTIVVDGGATIAP
jgi:NAD(P)-dependent dehydrogenase (short-subunit alcohol dehydrogenase family)